MPNLVEQRSSANLPSHLPQVVEHELRTCVTRLIPPISASQSRYSIEAVDAPSQATRQALSIRRDSIDRWLEPAGIMEANKAYNGLVATMATANVDDETAVREMQGFIEATARLPLFALTAACTAFQDGKIGDGKWMPKPGQICIEAGKRVAELAKERREIDAVLTAEVKAPKPNADRRAQLVAEARRLSASMSMHDAVERARRAGREFKPDEIPDLQLSPEAVRARYAAHAESFKGQHMPPMGAALRRSLEQAGAIRPAPPESPARFDESEVA